MRLHESLGIPLLYAPDGARGARLVGSACELCGAVAFPRRVVCLECGGQHGEAVLSGRGVLHSVTRIANPPAGFAEPYLYGCVDLIEGPRVLSLLDGDGLEIGSRVRAVVAPVRDGVEGFRFEVDDA